MLSLGGHVAVVLVVFHAQPQPPPPPELPPVQVQLVQFVPEPPKPPAPPDPAPEPKVAPPKPAPPKVEKKKPTPPKRAIARPTPAPREPSPLVAETAPVVDRSSEVSDAELASAATAGAGGGGGGGGGQCDMAGWLQTKLRKDRRVQAALAQAHKGQAIRVWNGDWITHPGQDGKGLAAVREAIMWEVAFAPEACRKQRVRGLILLSLNDGAAPARVVIGAGDWRWSDVLWAAGSPRRGG